MMMCYARMTVQVKKVVERNCTQRVEWSVMGSWRPDNIIHSKTSFKECSEYIKHFVTVTIWIITQQDIHKKLQYANFIVKYISYTHEIAY